MIKICKHVLNNLLKPFIDFLWNHWFLWVILPIFLSCLIVFHDVIKTNIQIIFSAMLVITSGIMCYYVWQQKQIQKYDKTFKIYITLVEFIYKVITNTTETIETEILNDAEKVMSIILYGKFMFRKDKNMVEFLEEFNSNMSSLVQKTVHLIRAKKQNNIKEIFKLQNEIEKKFKCFKNQLEIIDKIFEKYLRI